MITSSPGSMVTIMQRMRASMPPAVTMTSRSGSEASPESASARLETACLRGRMPAFAV